MSNETIPHYIEPYKLADRDITYQGDIDLADLTRLREALATDQAKISIKVDFKRGDQRQILMLVTFDAVVELLCQRCLEVMPFVIDEQRSYMFVHNKKEETMLLEGFEALEVKAKDPFDLKVLIEDELLLALPIIPVHKLEECQQSMMFPDDSSIENEVKPNPFSVLAQLKRDPKA